MALAMLPVLSFLVATVSASAVRRAPDPCAVIGGQKWVAPADLRACFESFPVNETIKSMTLDTVERTLAFHTSTNYQIQAPEPYASDVHEDILGDIARIRRTRYPSEFQMYVDLSRSMKRLMDGHCMYYDFCYDGLFQTYLPIPLVLLTNEQGEQAVHIAPEAFEVASTEFADQISVWQDALPGSLKGNLESLSGAKVLAINGQDPFIAVNANAATTGRYQSLGARQNAFFAGYQRGQSGWNYIMGDFAQMALPLTDFAQLTVQRVNSSEIDSFVLPYRSRIDSSATNFTDSASLRQNNCLPGPSTNGGDIYEDVNSRSLRRREFGGRFSPDLRLGTLDDDLMRHPISVNLNDRPMMDASLPGRLQPSSPASGLGAAQFYMLDDGKTGVLALGQIPPDFSENLDALVSGFQGLVERGATQLILDLTNNDGGFICTAAFLHRIIVGPKDTAEPQALLDTKMRAGPLARLIVQKISEGADPWEFLYYNPVRWSFDNDTQFPPLYNYMENPVRTVINGREDAFSQRMGRECRDLSVAPPDQPLFDPRKIVIVGNGRCSSSCSLVAVTLNKLEGAKTVVVGGLNDAPQHYAGSIGGQNIDFFFLDREIKSTKLKNHTLAPPDFLTNSFLTITWRLAFGVDDPNEPEEWQDRTPDATHPLTLETVNNPFALWKSIAAAHF